MDAIILAGGTGTRLRPVVKDVPKPMAEINGRPFLEYLLDFLHKYGINKVILSIGYKSGYITEYFINGYRGMKLEFSIEKQPLGTGGAIVQALSHAQGDDLLVLNGDSFFAVDLKALVNAHQTSASDITIALKSMNNFDRYGAVTVVAGQVTGFEEKKHCDAGYINAGVYAIRKACFTRFSTEKKFSFESDFLQRYVSDLIIRPFISNGYFIDIGIPDDYLRARSELQFHQ